ncbi:phage tail sheath family protein [Photorhabdus laumondii subsp. laumondii]|uniref:Photorhabdus luminescens subsp. laumondii TTO1 complete genome segment 6/17 n=2 Tax=Photorhabdus laumondii subsp. laumondii TaxID=141679 RepID=Q7N661_PHOLL|nr:MULTISPECIES: phage tail sheath C-terminal domain-containing protein [Photorhabdus]AWK41548.1 phage tail protein [Photorhabdus laumondii subsp. laumondii]AXG42346.1 phage tail sheath family protein [Photorhabdus laumondii subsp. laumondii]AXG46870.1 phage tail sheath family protein [Photorhabdus laumondii subsp. laumondii]KTL62361.1 phage tail protein [Photorhabdus laumondii subsp. laumondii]MCC8382171.1 phage tail sheath family protein [Photorhabdus laumondii]
MPTTPTYPGVYIEEDASLALSVSQGNTAIPVFIGRFSPKKISATPEITRVSSWLDFTNLFNVGCIRSVAIKSTESTPPPSLSVPEKSEGNADNKHNNVEDKSNAKIKHIAETKNNAETKANAEVQDYAAVVPVTKPTHIDGKSTHYIHQVITVTYTTSSDALKLYFQNGGGPCYILPISNSEDTNTLALIPELIEQALEITLIVCPEQDPAYQSAIYGNLTPLLKAGYFLIADNPNKETALSVSLQSQTATYYPAVKVSQLIQVEENTVTVSGYQDAKVTHLAELKQQNSGLYKQVIEAIKQKIADNKKLIPASAIMAGVYCATDARRGVWKAPANVVLSGISDVADRLTEDEQGTMNQKGINAIRYFTNKGFVVWGTRTLQDDDNWRYIPVRRLFNAAERDIKQAMRFAVFEPNSQPTWERVRSAIDNYLHQLWQQGALAGNSPQEAYFVQIGQGVTMSDIDIKQGKMVVKVGMAAVRPAEFIILQFSQNVAQ